MKVYKITVREKITDPSGNQLDDDALRTLDSLYFFNVEVQEDLSPFGQLTESLDEFERTHPHLSHAIYTIEPAS